MEQPPAAADSTRRAQAEIVRLGYSDLPAGLAATLVVSVGLAWIVARHPGAEHVWFWLTAMLLITAWRFGTVLWFRRIKRDRDQAVAGERRFIIGAVASGLGWGYAAWVFYPIMTGDHELPLLVL